MGLVGYLKQNVESIVFIAGAVLFQGFLLVILSIWADYPHTTAETLTDLALYPFFRDVNIMIFFGFGFLMTFLRRYGYGAIGYSLFIAALVVQWSIVNQFFWEDIDEGPHFDHRRPVTVYVLLHGLFCSAAVLISFGAVLGKVTPLQILVLAIVEPFFFWLNIYINALVLEAIDIGGGMYIHTFGAYFGVTLTLFLTSKDTKGHPDNCSCYSSDIFSLAGTLFLWIMWPSFNAAIAVPGKPMLRAIVNTVLSLCGATVTTFFLSRLVGGHKFDPVHVQNATLAGGVAMGVAADLDLYPATAAGCGAVTAVFSVLGYKYLTPFLSNKLRLQDVCGVHNLHGMPGIIGSIIAILATGALQDEEFPRGDHQAAYQLAATGISLGLAIGGGLVTGALMWAVGKIGRISASDYYNDRTFWHLPTDYEWVVDKLNEDDEDELEMDEIARQKRRGGTRIRSAAPKGDDDEAGAAEMKEVNKQKKAGSGKRRGGTRIAGRPESKADVVKKDDSSSEEEETTTSE